MSILAPLVLASSFTANGLPAPKSIKALAMDLDGTILAPGAVLSERTQSAIKKCIERGLKIIIATGRSMESAERYRLPLNAAGPMVYFNGAVVAEMPAGEIIKTTLLDTKAVEICVDLSREMDIHFQVYFLDGKNGEARKITLLAEKDGEERGMYHKHTGILTELGDLKENLKSRGNKTCIKAMYLAEPDVQAKLRPRLDERLGGIVYVAQTLHNFLEIMDKEASKGSGLEFIMERLSLKKEEVIAFGDEENDLPMLKAAGFSVVPSNAKALLKESADLVIGSNAEDSVAAFLEQFFEL